jgi:hypothetical protein
MYSEPENLGSRPGDDAFETIQFCRRSSTFVKVRRKSSTFIVKLSSGMPETFSDIRLNWSCVTRCGCRTTSSTFFTVYGSPVHKICCLRLFGTGPGYYYRSWFRKRKYGSDVHMFIVLYLEAGWMVRGGAVSLFLDSSSCRR